MGAEVWPITGAQAFGKSTLANLLGRQFGHRVHVRSGQFYRWAVRGRVEFDDQDRQEEARRLLDLRYRLPARVAVEYALRRDVSTVSRRDEARNSATGRVAYRGAVTPEVDDAPSR